MENDTIEPGIKKIRHSYTIGQKREALRLLEASSEVDYPLAFTAASLGISKSVLLSWKGKEAKILDQNVSVTSRKIHPGPNLKYVFEEEVVDWIREKRAQKLPISNNVVAFYTFRRYEESFKSYETCLRWSILCGILGP